ncbi:MAG: hypothetical protein AB7T49_11235 [Oligoflexales bacterium]
MFSSGFSHLLFGTLLCTKIFLMTNTDGTAYASETKSFSNTAGTETQSEPKALVNKEIECHTPTQTVIVLTKGKNDYVLQHWQGKGSTSDPDIVLNNGKVEVQGHGVCVSTHWVFTKGKIAFRIAELGCSDTPSPKGAIGTFEISEGGKRQIHEYCFH